MSAIDMRLLGTAHDDWTVVSPDRETVATFDREGRLISFYRQGTAHLRSLSSRVFARWNDNGAASPSQALPTRRRRELSRAEARALFSEVHAMVAGMLAGGSKAPAEGELRRRLEDEILPWTPDALLAEEVRFHRAYKPISILPPDQYQSIVLQATEGCTWNRCTFCNFYQGRTFRAKTAGEFRVHVEAVKDLLGKGVRLRRGVFLADGNALVLSRPRLEPLLEIAAENFPGQPFYGFVDLVGGEHHEPQDWRLLAAMGLRRVYIGMETGLDELLRFLNKPGSAAEMVDLVRELKDAGVAVGLIVMVGVGGQEFRETHAHSTLEALAQMPLTAGPLGIGPAAPPRSITKVPAAQESPSGGFGDIVYLSPFVEHPDSEYARRRAGEGLIPMDEAEVEAEMIALARRIRALGLKVSRYDIRDFLY